MAAVLRRASPEDAQAISGILAESWKAAYVGIVPQKYLDGLRPDHSAQRMRRDIQDEAVKAQILLDDGAPVGAVCYGKSRDGSLPGWGEIVCLYIRPGFCRKGYGKKLLRAAVQELVQDGFQKCFLWVLAQNENARQFYAAMGFRETADVVYSEIVGKSLAEIRYTFCREGSV